MSLENTYHPQRRREHNNQSNAMEIGVHGCDSWVPDTPTKPGSLGQQHTMGVSGYGSPDKLVYDELKCKDQVLEGDSCAAPVESNSSNAFLFHDETTRKSLPSDDVELVPPSSSKKRKNNHKEVNDQLPKGTKRKIYRPKVFSQLSRRQKKPQAKSTNTPKPSTPKQKRNYVKKGCRRQLFDEDSVSLPFLKKVKVLKVEQGGFDNSTVNNELGIGYNSLQSYGNVTSLASLCLVESKLIGANFPLSCKKKRIGRQRFPLEKLLTPFKKGKRSKSFVRKARHCVAFDVEDNGIVSKKMMSIVKKIRSSKKKLGRKTKELVVYKESGQLVPYKKSSLVVDVMLEEETLRVWNLLKDEKGHEENDEMKRKYWEDIRTIFRDKVESFICHMHVIQGDRRFSPWKGSVLDSVVGAFLTQNVSDHLSSSAFMTLAAKFPIKTTSCEKSKEDLATHDREESMENNTVIPGHKFDKETEDFKVEAMESEKAREYSNIDNKGIENNSSLTAEKPDPPDMQSGKKKTSPKKKNISEEEKEKQRQYWDTLRKIHTKSPRDSDHVDSVDWEGVRCARASEVARAIASRGQHNIIASRIQVDVNVGRIVIRLGWVPLQPLPEQIQIHNLEMFPDSNKIQQYLWPRLCTLDQRTLYELHYQLITFGKVFCTKRNPNCKACPMRNECKHYASAVASARPALPAVVQKTADQKIAAMLQLGDSYGNSTLVSNFASIGISEVNNTVFAEASKACEPIIEMPASPERESTEFDNFEVNNENEEFYQDYIDNDIEDIPTIKLNSQEMYDYFPEEIDDGNKSKALVALHGDAANIPITKMKNVSRLKTERLVYVLPDGHPLLLEHTPREYDDPSPYLLVVWTAGELESSLETKTNLQEEANSLTVPGTLLIPCRTGMKGRFPLNGTYFQVNEVFADYASMIHPINVPRKWLWKLEKRIVYFGTGTSAIMRGLSTEQIHNIFWKGKKTIVVFILVTELANQKKGTPSSSPSPPQHVPSSSDTVSPPTPQHVPSSSDTVSPPTPQHVPSSSSDTVSPAPPQHVSSSSDMVCLKPTGADQMSLPALIQDKEDAKRSDPVQPFCGPLPKGKITFSRPLYRPLGLRPVHGGVPKGNPNVVIRPHPIRPTEPVKIPSSLAANIPHPIVSPLPLQPPQSVTLETMQSAIQSVTLETMQSAIHTIREGFMNFIPTSTIPPKKG
ncbi:hypothetical protein VNO77_28791 [Canavalia gladiata]|uniref:Demeter RRM-fold domain-containing protein n=1 Tax=Canavalia gladiata TaxID=3824 RepID=A0AAN9KVW8_CANGL